MLSSSECFCIICFAVYIKISHEQIIPCTRGLRKGGDGFPCLFFVCSYYVFFSLCNLCFVLCFSMLNFTFFLLFFFIVRLFRFMFPFLNVRQYKITVKYTRQGYRRHFYELFSSRRLTVVQMLKFN